MSQTDPATSPAGTAGSASSQASGRSASSPHVEFIDVRKTYDGETLVVKNLNLEIQRGEFLTLLGPSGSGKTTSLMMLAGFEVPTSGDIRLAGRSIARLPPHRRDIGMVFQNYALFPHMTVAENLAFPLSVRKMPKAEIGERVAKALGMVHLSQLGGRRPAELSGGQQQRVALARALVFDPQLVLMDEPLGALDKQLREHMQLEIKHIHESLGVTVVYVTHDQTEALTFADEVVVMSEGRIVQAGTPQSLFDAPAHTFVGYFIGSPGMNLLDAQVQGATAHVAGTAIPLGAAYAAPQGRVQIGIRPDAARPAAEGLPFRLIRAEDVGHHRILRGEVAGAPFNLVVPEDQPIPAAFDRVALDPARIGVFVDDWRIEPLERAA